VRPHGLKGEVKVQLTCPGPERIEKAAGLRLVKDGQELKTVSVQRIFLHTDGDAVIRFKEVKSVGEAEALRGAEVAVSAKERATLPENTYYLDDLVGLTVEQAEGGVLGTIEEVLDMPANWVCVVRNNVKEILIPFLKSVVQEVDLKARRMKVKLLEEVDGDAED